MAQIKGKNSIASINISKWVKNMSREKEVIFLVMNLDLKPHMVSLLLSSKRGHRATPLK